MPRRRPSPKASETIRVGMETHRLVSVGPPGFKALSRELKTAEAAIQWLNDLATECQQPVCVTGHLDGHHGLATVVVRPDGWTKEKLAGWIGGMSEELSRLFGPVQEMRWTREWVL